MAAEASIPVHNFRHNRCDSFTRTISFEQEDGSDRDLTGSTFRMQVRDRNTREVIVTFAEVLDPAVLGITRPDATHIRLHIPVAISKDLREGNHVYDIAETVGTDVARVLRGDFLTNDVITEPA
jgi:hypothetical protein